MRAPLAIAFLLATSACRPRGPAPATPPPGEAWLRRDEVAAAGIVVAPVDAHDVDDVLVTGGRITFDGRRVAHVFSPLSGRVVKIVADLGAHVDAGQTLALIDSPDVGAATSDLSKASASLIAAEQAYDRERALREAGAASEAALEQAEDAWRSAEAERERAAQRVALLHAGRSVSQLYPLTSPIAGQVLARRVTPGLELQGAYAGASSPELFTIGDLEDVWLLADVSETDLARVHEGARVELTVTGIDAVFEGKVDWLSDMLDPQTRTARLRCTIANPDGLLRPEMYGTVRVSVAPARALAVPRSSLVRLGDYTFVVVDRGAAPDGRERFERLPVVAEETPGPWVPVTHGLERGERVVVAGAQALASRF